MTDETLTSDIATADVVSRAAGRHRGALRLQRGLGQRSVAPPCMPTCPFPPLGPPLPRSVNPALPLTTCCEIIRIIWRCTRGSRQTVTHDCPAVAKAWPLTAHPKCPGLAPPSLSKASARPVSATTTPHERNLLTLYSFPQKDSAVTLSTHMGEVASYHQAPAPTMISSNLVNTGVALFRLPPHLPSPPPDHLEPGFPTTP